MNCQLIKINKNQSIKSKSISLHQQLQTNCLQLQNTKKTFLRITHCTLALTNTLHISTYPHFPRLRHKQSRSIRINFLTVNTHLHRATLLNIYLRNEPTWCTKFLFYNKFISCLYMFRAHVLIIRMSKLHYTASGIITPIGGRLVHRCTCERDEAV